MSINDYTNLITSEHADKPKFVATVTAVCSPMSSLRDLFASGELHYDLDFAVGSQLDVIGQWIGISRNIILPLTVYFSFDEVNLGFDAGVWKGPKDPTTGVVALPDDLYRLILKARILNNRWDGSIPSAYELSNLLYGVLGYRMFIEDHGDLTMSLGVVGAGPAPEYLWSLLINGYLDVKPICVRIASYISQSVPNAPIFSFDLNSEFFSGFDTGAFARISNP